MGLLTDDINNLGQCLACERFKIVINGMHEAGYEKFREDAGLKRTVEQVKHLYWKHPDSLAIIKEKVENFPIKDEPISKMLIWIEYVINKEIKSSSAHGHTLKRPEDNSVFAMFRVKKRHFRMLSVCIIEKSL